MQLSTRLGLATSLSVLTLLSILGQAGNARGQATPERPRLAFAAWDTGKPSAQPLGAETLETKPGWLPIADGDTTHVFAGDAVLSNGRVLAVARRQGTGVELYSLGLGTPIYRSRLALTPAALNERLALTANSRTALGLEVSSKAGTARFRLKKGEHFVEVQAASGAAALRLECASRFAVLPDFFADDILFDARKVPVDRVELPSENFLLHFTGKEDAIVMGVFENRAQDVRVTLSGKGDERVITGSEIDFGKAGSKIWVAVLESAGLWHTRELKTADAATVLPLAWKMPFVAQWRVDFTRKDGLTDSWDMLLPDKDGFIKPSWLAQDGKIRAATRTASGEVDRDAYRPGGRRFRSFGPGP